MKYLPKEHPQLQVYVAQTPAGTSVKNMAHFAQGIRHDAFRMYNYGVAGGAQTPLDLTLTHTHHT